MSRAVKAPAKKRCVAAPVRRNDDLVDEICLRISAGETLRSICRDKHMPSWQAVYQWMDADESIASRIARAREKGHDAISEECFDIADEPPEISADGKRDSAYVAWQKNRIWTRMQLLAKWNPKKYGDRATVELTGGIADRLARARARDE